MSSYEIDTSQFSHADIFDQNRAQVTLAVQDETSGIAISTTKDLIMVGAKFYWSTTLGVTVRLRLWDYVPATSLATIDVDVPALTSGIFVGRFNTPIALRPAWSYMLTRYCTSAINELYMSAANFSIASNAVMVLTDTHRKVYSPGWYLNGSCYGAGDALPSAIDLSNAFGITPLFQR